MIEGESEVQWEVREINPPIPFTTTSSNIMVYRVGATVAGAFYEICESRDRAVAERIVADHNAQLAARPPQPAEVHAIRPHRGGPTQGTVDDVAITCEMFRLEQMTDDAWWAAAIRDNGTQVMFWLRWDKKLKHIVCTVTEDTIGCGDDAEKAAALAPGVGAGGADRGGDR